MKVLVLGGTGVISREIVKLLLKNNVEVTVYNRGNRNLYAHHEVEQIIGNKQDGEAFYNQMKNRQFDAVIDMICYDANGAENLLKTFSHNTGHIIVCSSSAAYERPFKILPATEAEGRYTGTSFLYAKNKAQMEIYLEKRFEEDQLPITIIRPSLTFGEGSQNLGVLRQNYGIAHRIKNGKPLVMFGDGTVPVNFTFAPDLAKGFVGVIGKKETFGETYHVTSEEMHLWNDLYEEFGKIIGIAPKIVHIPAELLFKASPKLCEHLYVEKMYPMLYDNTKIRTVIPNFKAEISLHEGLKYILKWFEAESNTIDLEKDQLEDKLVALYERWSNEIV